MCVINSKASELAGIATQSASGIDRNQAGKFTGILRDESTNLVWNVIPPPTEEEFVTQAGLACEKIVEAGITSIHWIVLSPIEVSVIQKLHIQRKLPLRVNVIVPASLFNEISGSNFEKTSKNKMLQFGGVEIFADGYLAAGTAALFEPYSDNLGEKGRLLCSNEEMIEAAAKISGAGFQLVIHAVGDKAVDSALSVIERTSSGKYEKMLPCRIEQAAVLNKGLVERMKKQSLVVSVQPRVITSEFSVWSAVNRLGSKRAKWLFPLKTLIESGIRVIAGSDCPMEPLNPLLGIQEVVAREAFPEERLSVEDALRLYTVNAAYASFEEDIKGSIEVGKLADVTVLSGNPMSVLPDKISDLNVEMTIVGGRIIYPKSSNLLDE
jgi:predicted amidohydrolase YtcJ